MRSVRRDVGYRLVPERQNLELADGYEAVAVHDLQALLDEIVRGALVVLVGAAGETEAHAVRLHRVGGALQVLDGALESGADDRVLKIDWDDGAEVRVVHAIRVGE